MANKNINILMKLTDQFTNPMMKATNATKQQQRQIKSLQTRTVSYVNKANTKFLSLTKSLAKVAAGFVGISGALSIMGLKNVASEAMELASAQIEAETKLENALKNVDSIASGGADAISAAKKELTSYASELQNVGVIGDEVTIAGMQQLATYGMNTDQVKALSASMDDMLVKQYGLNATQENATAVAKVLGKAMNGSYTSLSKFGITLSDAEQTELNMLSDTERAARLAEMIEDRVGGINEAMADTDQGKIQQFSNAYGDMLEVIGAKLLPLKAQMAEIGMTIIPYVQQYATKAIDVISAKVDQFTAWFKKNKESIKEGLTNIKNVLEVLWNNILSPLINFVISHAGTITKIIAAIGAAFVALNIVMKIVAIVQAIQEVIAVIQLVGSVIGVTSLAALGPIALVVAAIAGIVAVGVLVYKNWDTIKEKAVEIFTAIVSFVKTAANNFLEAWRKPIDTLKSWIKSIYKWVKKALEWLSGLSDSVNEAQDGMSASGYVTTGNATGTAYWKGGLTHINEGGRGEIVNLPSGTQIIPHDVAEKSVQGSTNVNVTVNVQGNVIGNQSFMEQCGSYISSKIISALAY